MFKFVTKVIFFYNLKFLRKWKCVSVRVFFNFLKSLKIVYMMFLFLNLLIYGMKKISNKVCLTNSYCIIVVNKKAFVLDKTLNYIQVMYTRPWDHLFWAVFFSLNKQYFIPSNKSKVDEASQIFKIKHSSILKKFSQSFVIYTKNILNDSSSLIDTKIKQNIEKK